jgi:Fe2+ or Zn2+ uptake regulation protein
VAFVRYRALPDAPFPKLRYYVNEAKKIYLLLNQSMGEWLTAEDITNRLIELGRSSGEGVPENLSRRVYESLKGLLNSHAIEHGKFTGKKQSNISLTQEQRNTLAELVETLDKFQSLDPEILKKGEERANYFLSHPQETATLMEKARNSSPAANQRPVIETTNFIISLIKQFKSPLTEELLPAIISVSERRIEKSSILHILSQLEKQGIVVSAPDKGRKRWMMRQETKAP